MNAQESETRTSCNFEYVKDSCLFPGWNYPGYQVLDSVKETYKGRGRLMDVASKKLSNMVGNNILTPGMKEVVKSVRKQPGGEKRMFVVGFAFNGKGEVLAGNINLLGEYIDKLKDESESIYRALLNLKIDVPALKKLSPDYFQDFSESDVFKFFVFFVISGRLTKMFSTCYADLEETGNK